MECILNTIVYFKYKHVGLLSREEEFLQKILVVNKLSQHHQSTNDIKGTVCMV